MFAVAVVVTTLIVGGVVWVAQINPVQVERAAESSVPAQQPASDETDAVGGVAAVQRESDRQLGGSALSRSETDHPHVRTQTTPVAGGSGEEKGEVLQEAETGGGAPDNLGDPGEWPAWDPRHHPQVEHDPAYVQGLHAVESVMGEAYAGETQVPFHIELSAAGWGAAGVVGVTRDTVCPVAGPVSFIDSWGYPRSGGRSHKGTDMFAVEGTPVVSPRNGVVYKLDLEDHYVVGTGRGDLGGITVWVVTDDGTAWYLAHLQRVRDGLRVGQRVSAGEVVGYVGRSGNAATTAPHLHIQMHPHGGAAVNPYQVLAAACR